MRFTRSIDHIRYLRSVCCFVTVAHCIWRAFLSNSWHNCLSSCGCLIRVWYSPRAAVELLCDIHTSLLPSLIAICGVWMGFLCQGTGAGTSHECGQDIVFLYPDHIEICFILSLCIWNAQIHFTGYDFCCP